MNWSFYNLISTENENNKCTVQVIGCDDVDKRKVGGQEVNIVAV